MPVVVHFVDLTTKRYNQATAANNQDSLLRVSKWNSKKRRLEDLEVLPADIVTLAEVFDRGGVLQRIELGTGRRQP